MNYESYFMCVQETEEMQWFQNTENIQEHRNILQELILSCIDLFIHTVQFKIPFVITYILSKKYNCPDIKSEENIL